MQSYNAHYAPSTVSTCTVSSPNTCLVIGMHTHVQTPTYISMYSTCTHMHICDVDTSSPPAHMHARTHTHTPISLKVCATLVISLVPACISALSLFRRYNIRMILRNRSQDDCTNERNVQHMRHTCRHRVHRGRGAVECTEDVVQ